MEISFNATRTADAPANTLFEVITDYASYPTFNRAVTDVEVLAQDDDGAEFVAVRRTAVAKRVRARDRYERGGDLVVERTYEGSASARSTWIVHPVDGHRCTLTIDASQSMEWLRGMLMRPLLKRLFYGINFRPFIREAERRARQAPSDARSRT